MTGSGRHRQSAKLGWRATVVVAITASAALAPGEGAAGTPGAAGPPSRFVPVGPLRLADTRQTPCGCTDTGDLVVPVVDRDGVPDGAVAVVITLTATQTESPGFLTAFPTGTVQPSTSNVNTRPDATVANSAIVPIGDDGSISVFRSTPTEVVVDITGVFVAANSSNSSNSSRAGRFTPTSPRRLLDTRLAGPVGALEPGATVTVPLPTDMPIDALAMAINLTSVNDVSPGFLVAYPTGTERPLASNLNTNGTGKAIAVSVIVPVSADGFTIYSLAGGDVIVDMVGWFTGPSASDSTDGMFRSLAATRLLDTRDMRPRLWPGGTIEVANPVAGASALVTNVTATRSDRAGFVTAYPAGTLRSETSSLNPASHNHTLANLTITQVADRGLAFYGLAGTDLVVDLTGYFTGTPVASTLPVPNNTPHPARVLLVGDSTLAVLSVYPYTRAALQGFDPIVDAAPCRRLLRPSCLSNTTGLIPNTAVEGITDTAGSIDMLVVKTGYNDWFSDFPKEFDAVVNAARAKGAHTIIWLSYNIGSHSRTSSLAYHENNIDLFQLVQLPQYSDVVLADWQAYSAGGNGWFSVDGIHLGPSGGFAVADYVSRWVAFVEHKSCPQPWTVGGVVPDPCPNPDAIGPVQDIRSLYES